MTGPIAEPFPVGRIRRLASATLAPPTPEPSPGRPLRSLHLNESPFPPAPNVTAAMQEAARALNRYPDHEGKQLIAALAARLGIAPERIVIGAGSNEILFLSGDVALDAGDEAIAPDPGFVTYAKAIAIRGATTVLVPVCGDGVLDVDAMLAAVTPRTRLIYVASPNNPTGGLLDGSAIERLIAGLPEHALLHFDDAYFEFGRHAGGPDVLPMLEHCRAPWILTRTFSKAYGLAGARIGYGIASAPAVADAFRKSRVTFSVSAMALAGALTALDETAHTAALLDHTARERERLTAALAHLGLQVLPSAANFIAAVSPRPASELAGALQRDNILVMPMPWRDTPGMLRITIGTTKDNDAVIAGLARAMQTPTAEP
jgi:histidinol-phosphate aminotransferase